ncbi:MAG: hypothetical protein A2190_00380 [Lysobacterales bacterium RIFOXYA1_FULL_69_10]|nr:MAG: hypothetical protein A2190_00380 [Xanthomonadales bacterium RIFOXYA1_FULL_69_10]
MFAAVDNVPFPLFHGTSTLFLDDIVQYGLGGENPIAAWGVLEFARVLLPYVETHLVGDQALLMKIDSFKRMAGQDVAGFNWQHGDTYLSPSRSTAVRYATNKRYGSELLTYTIELVQELVQRNAPGVRDALYQQYPQMFRFLDISPAPLLVEVSGLPVHAITADEHGRCAEGNLAIVKSVFEDDPEMVNTLCQQFNFRLRTPQPISRLRISLINVYEWSAQGSMYTLYPLGLD